MVRKKIAIAVLALSALQADVASALGLGGVAVKSSLNQPLEAEIRLLDTGELDESQVRIQLAEGADFERAGVERDYFLNNLRFTVEMGERGGIIRVTTREPVIEPYLNFIIEARWPSGRLLREYAVLLDPPTFSAGASPSTPMTGSGLATVQQGTKSAPSSTYTAPRAPAPAPTQAPPASLPAAERADSYRVQHNDTLSGIASRFRPADDVTVQQTMVALQRANPNAFIRNNINLVKSGYVLRLPNADDARGVTLDVAQQEVAEQNRAWRTGDDRQTALSGPQLDARPQAPDDAAPAYNERERLSIATAGTEIKPTAGEGTGTSSAGVDALRNELSVTQESLDSAKRENDELQSRLDDMERQIGTLQRLLALKDDQLAALQTSSAEGQQQEDQQQEETALAPAPASGPGADKPAPGGENPPPDPRRPAEPDLLASLLANPLLLAAAGAGALLLLAGALLLARRRRAAAEAEATALAEIDLGPDVEPAFTPETEQSPTVIEPLSATATAAVPLAAEDVEPSTFAAAPLRSETGDVIAEADIYVAYGRYQQAVDLLRGAIAQEPARSDLRVKLLEVLLEMRDRGTFRHEFVALQALDDEDAVIQVKEMLSSVDGVSGWLDDLPSAAMATAALSGAAAWPQSEPGDTAVTEDNVAGGVPEDPAEDEFLLDLEELERDEGVETVQGGENTLGDLDWLNEATAESAENEEDELSLDEDLILADEGDLTLEEADELTLDEGELNNEAELLNLDTQPAADLEFPTDEPLELNEAGIDDADPELLGGSAELMDDDSLAGDTFTSLEAPLAEATPAPESIASGTETADELEELDLDLGGEDLDLALSELDEGGDEDALTAAFGAMSEEEIEAGNDRSFSASSFGSNDGDESDDLDVDLDTAEALDLGLADEEIESLGEVEEEPAPLAALVSEPDPVAVESAAFGDIEGLGDLDLGELDELDANGDLNSLDDLDRPPEVQPAADVEAAVDEAFAEFNALGLDSEQASETTFDVDLAALEPYTPETAEADAGDEFDFLADADEVSTKLDLARAYIDMGDTDGARDILDEVVLEGTHGQQEEAQALLDRIA